MEKIGPVFNESKIIGITGTNGKTTTTYMIKKIFEEYGKEMVLVNNGDLENSNSLLDLHLNKKAQWVTLELSSTDLKNKIIDKIDFDTVILTNVSMESLENQEDFEEYFLRKKHLFNHLKENRRAIINGDDPWGLKVVEGKEKIYTITYGLKSKSTITASSIDVGQSIKFNYCIQRSIDSYKGETIEVQEFPIEINLLGYHNIYNALAAITLALIYEIPVEVVQRALKKLPPIGRRLEYSRLLSYYILDDYANNPSSIESTFHTLQSLDYKNAFAVIAIGGSKGVAINKKNAEVIATWAPLLKIKELFITDSKEMVDNENVVKSKERKVFLKTLKRKNIPYEYTPFLVENFKKLSSQVNENDLIILLGSKGMDKGKQMLKALME